MGNIVPEHAFFFGRLGQTSTLLCVVYVRLSCFLTPSFGPNLMYRPSARVATAQRKLELVNDKLAKSSTPRSVECAQCGTVVPLEGEEEYDLRKWQEHKVWCSRSAIHKPSCLGIGSIIIICRVPLNDSQSASTASIPIPSASSIASTEGTECTVIAPEASPERKRRRSEDSHDAVNPHPSRRARSENYVPAVGQAVGILGWLSLPFKIFVRGFKEGMKTSAETL